MTNQYLKVTTIIFSILVLIYPVDKDFQISIESLSEENIKLYCSTGCAWEYLSNSCTDEDCNFEFDQFGMYNGQITQTDPDLASFRISLNRENDTISFTCENACNWTNLSYKHNEESTGKPVLTKEGILFN